MIPADKFSRLLHVSDRTVYVPICYDSSDDSVEVLPPCDNFDAATWLAELHAEAAGWEFQSYEDVESDSPAGPGQSPVKTIESRPLYPVYFRIEEWHVLG